MSFGQMICILLLTALNALSYMVGRADGKRTGRDRTIEIIMAVAPEEMQSVMDKMRDADPVKVALSIVRRTKSENGR